MRSTDIVELALAFAFLGALAAKICAQRRSGRRAISLDRARSRAYRGLEAFLVASLFLWFGTIAAHACGFAPAFFEPRLVDGVGWEAAGSVYAVASVALLVTAFVQMGRSWRIGIDRDTEDRLVTNGVFAWSRNPIFVAIDLAAVAVLCLSGSWVFLLSAGLILAGVHGQILREEGFLEQRYGEAYRAYRARVRRYLGRRAGATKPHP